MTDIINFDHYYKYLETLHLTGFAIYARLQSVTINLNPVPNF